MNFSTRTTTSFVNTPHGIQTTEIELLHEIYFLLKGLPSSLIEKVQNDSFRIVQPIYLPHLPQDTLLVLFKPIFIRIEKLNALRHFCKETMIEFPNWSSTSKDPSYALPNATPSYIALSFAWALSLLLNEYDQHLNNIYTSVLVPSCPPRITLNSTSASTTQFKDIQLEHSSSSRCSSIQKISLLSVLPLFQDSFLEHFSFPKVPNLTILDHLYQCIQIHPHYLRFFLLAASGLFNHLEVYITQGECGPDFFIQPLLQHSKEFTASSTWKLHQVMSNVPRFLEPHLETILILGQSAANLRRSSNLLFTSLLTSPLPSFHFQSHLFSELQRQLQLPSSFPWQSVSFPSTLLLDFPKEFDKAFTYALLRCPSASEWVSFVKTACKLQSHFQMLSRVYLFQTDGTSFCDPLFDWIYIENKEWKDLEFLGPLCRDWFQSCSPTSPSLQNLFDIHLVHVSGFDALHITFEVDFPINAIITTPQIALYNKWFTNLLHLKQAQYLLLRKTWNRVPNTRLYNGLRHLLLQFVNAVSFFWLSTVIAREYISFQKSIETVLNFEQLIEAHSQYLQRTLQLGLLETSPVLKAILSVFYYAVEFSVIPTTDIEKLVNLKENVEKVIAFISRALSAISTTTSHVNTLLYSITRD